MTFYGYSWGSNSYGQLSLGHNNDTYIPTTILIEEDCHHNSLAKSINFGSNHSLLYKTCNCIFFAGKINYFNNKFIEKFTKIMLPDNLTIKHVECGWESIILVSENNDLIIHCLFQNEIEGENIVLEIKGNVNDLKIKFKLLTIHENIVNVKVGWKHIIILTNTGKVYSLGKNSTGQCAQALELTSISSPLMIKLPFVVKDISCGWESSFFLTFNNEVFSVGCNKHGECSSDSTVKKYFSPFLLYKSTIPIKALKTGWSHGAILNENGCGFMWGSNRYGQLYDSNNNFYFNKINQLNFTQKIKDIICGSQHTIVIDEDDNVYCFGWNEHGNCAYNPLYNQILYEPVLIKFTGRVSSKIFSNFASSAII